MHTMPAALTPPVEGVDEDLSVPRTSYEPTQTAAASKKRKVICFSGMILPSVPIEMYSS